MRPTHDEEQHYNLRILESVADARDYLALFLVYSDRSLSPVCLLDTRAQAPQGGKQAFDRALVVARGLADSGYYAGLREKRPDNPRELAFVPEKYLMIAAPVLEAIVRLMPAESPRGGAGGKEHVKGRIWAARAVFEDMLDRMRRQRAPMGARTQVIDAAYGPVLLELYARLAGGPAVAPQGPSDKGHAPVLGISS